MTGEDEESSPDDFMLSIYSNLLDQGWSMSSIDEMDIFYYFKVLAYRKRTKQGGQIRKGYIDQVI